MKNGSSLSVGREARPAHSPSQLAWFSAETFVFMNKIIRIENIIFIL